jgi:hypothetical protein
MAYWLLKSEPDEWSWAEQVAKGRGGAEWTGIRSFSAQQHLRAMKKGERAFFYHTGKARASSQFRRPSGGSSARWGRSAETTRPTDSVPSDLTYATKRLRRPLV